MISQTIPSTVPETDLSRRVGELAQTGGPEWVVPAAMFAVALLLLGAALVWLAEWRRVRR